MTKTLLQQKINTLPISLPSGSIRPMGHGAYYLSRPPVPPGLRSELREQHPKSGLWPVFLSGYEESPEDTWNEPDLVPQITADPPDAGSASSLLAARWKDLVSTSGLPALSRSRLLDEIAPFTQDWPGLASGTDQAGTADLIADDLAEQLINDPGTGLGLFPLQRGADVPWAAGWWAGQEILPIEASAILRSWEDRFGVRLLRLGNSSLVLSVPNPPRTLEQAQHIAVEHYAFCWDNFGSGAGALTRYAEELIGMEYWSFWWDRDPLEVYA